MRDRILSILRRYGYALLLTIYVAVLIGLHVAKRFPAPGRHDIFRLIGRPVTSIEGRVIDFPSTRWKQTRFVLEGDSVSEGKHFHGRALVTLAFPATDLSPGEWVRVHGWLSAPHPASGTHPFDEESYWASQGVYSLLRVWFPGRLEILRPAPWWYVRNYAWKFRRRFADFWETRLPPDEAAILLGITLGARGQLPAFLKDMCIRAGVYHIVVVSGQDVSLVIMLGLALLQALRVPRRQGFLICAAPIIFYACVVGADPPVVRAVAMALIGLSATALGRDTTRFQPLLLAAGGILLLSPETLFGASFQLSFGATASLLLLTSWMGDTHRFFPEKAWRRVAAWFFRMGVMCVAVNIGIGPMLVYYFQRFSLVGLLGNWLVFPLAGLLMIWGLAAGMLGLIFPSCIPIWSVNLLARLLRALTALIIFLGSGRWSAITLPAPSAWELAVYYGILFGILWLIHRRRTDAFFFHYPSRRHRL